MLNNDEYMILISGNTDAELNFNANELRRSIRFYKNNRNYTLKNISRNLMFCREYKAKRIVFLPTSTDELLELLDCYCEDDSKLPYKQFLTGDVDDDVTIVNTNLTEKANEQTFQDLAQLWCWGKFNNWHTVNISNDVFKRLNLGSMYYQPTKMRKIIEADELISTGAGTKKTDVEVDPHTQDLELHLDGSETFIQDHVVNGKPIVPAAMYVEYIYELLGETSTCSIKNIVWTKVVDSFPITLRVKITKNNKYKTIDFKDPDGIVCCTANVHSYDKSEMIHEEFPHKHLSNELNKNQIYQLFSKFNIQYGDNYSVLDSLKWGAETVESTIDIHQLEYRPFDMSLIDACFQSSLIPNMDRQDMSLPFSAKQITAVQSIEHTNHICIYRKGKTQDIYGYDKNDNLTIKLIGYQGVPVKNKDGLQIYSIKHVDGEKPRNSDFVASFNDNSLSYFIQNNNASQKAFFNYGLNITEITLRVESSNYKAVFKNLVEMFKTVMKKHLSIEFKVAVSIDNRENIPNAFAMYSFIKSAIKEIGAGSVKLITYKTLKNKKTEMINSNRKNSFKYDKRIFDDSDNNMIVEGGKYIVTGGTGKIGKEIANNIKRRGGIPIVIGRHAVDFVKDDEMSIKVDITSFEDLKKKLDERNLLDVSGVFHFAGELSDGLLLRKNIEKSENVLDSKILGILNLTKLLQNDSNLQFILLSSSLVALWGNIGQTDYAFANGYLNGYAFMRDLQYMNKEVHVKTSSVMWPLWKSGGMMPEKSELVYIQEHLGMQPLSMETGMNIVFNKSILSSACLMILNGEVSKQIAQVEH